MFEKKDKCLKKEMSIKYVMVHGVQVGGRYGQTWNNFWNIRTSLSSSAGKRYLWCEKDNGGKQIDANGQISGCGDAVFDY